MLSAMSSSVTQVFPRKRSREEAEAAPEFPALPGLSLERIGAFAAKSQAALEYIKKLPTNTSVICLPLLSPHKPPYRFKFTEDESVHMIMRQAYATLSQEVLDLNYRKYSGIYVRGPVGVGKSHLLYLLAAELRMNRGLYRVTYISDCKDWPELRMNRGLYRVTYISDCKDWRNNPYGYILKEFVTTFFDDVVDGRSIIDRCNAVQGADKEEKMIQLLEALISYVQQQNLQWIIICDQYNAFYARSVVADQFPFSIIDILAKSSGYNIKAVISASANNEGYPTEMKGWKTHDLPSHRFNDDEFTAWCGHYLFPGNVQVDPQSDEAVEALFWTGGVPYELDLLWKQPKATLQEKTLLYRVERMKEMSDDHAKFYRKLEDPERHNLKLCISRMALGLSPPASITGMDRQLFDIISDNEGNAIISALNPIARFALLTYHNEGLINSFNLVAELVFKSGDYTNDTKGRLVEKYIVNMLEQTKRFRFSCYQTTYYGLNNTIAANHNIVIENVVSFAGNKVPTQSSFNMNTTALFIPESPNYPGFDFFIWDSARKKLMGFQITIRNPFTTHGKMNSTGPNCQRWKTLCFGDSNHADMDLYWIIPKECVGTNTTAVTDYVIKLEDLHNDFTALSKLVLQ
ncbi:hypothetical protein MP638_004527 [Amoeboaphelidium occidentale]|nr:hypothetical protein MP638_004527 [Amoeboaphelidium occidentale]